MMRSTRLPAVLAAGTLWAALLTAACGTTSESEAAGNYTLDRMDGAALPVVIVTTPCTGFADSGTLNLTDGEKPAYTMTLEIHFECRNGPGPRNHYEERGTWTETGGAITFTATSPGISFELSPGSVSGSMLTVNMTAPSGAPDVPSKRVVAVWRK